jgi:hypothetical protein
MNKYLKICDLHYTKYTIFIALSKPKILFGENIFVYSEKFTVYVSALCGKMEMSYLVLKDLVRSVNPTPWSFQDVQENIVC